MSHQSEKVGLGLGSRRLSGSRLSVFLLGVHETVVTFSCCGRLYFGKHKVPGIRIDMVGSLLGGYFE